MILGPGPRGLSCLIAAQAAGAGWVGISGLDHDSDRLDLAARLGANLTVNIDVDDLGWRSPVHSVPGQTSSST
jgi:threonine dehydrogenase-like Zn-dependent dehydrogenase